MRPIENFPLHWVVGRGRVVPTTVKNVDFLDEGGGGVELVPTTAK